jgi:hypothetical protein
MFDYILRLLIAFDQFINVLICNGDPRETMSSVAWRMERMGHFWGFMRPVIDTLFFFQDNHCQRAYEWGKSFLKGNTLP